VTVPGSNPGGPTGIFGMPLWACSSVWESAAFATRGSRVRVPPGPLARDECAELKRSGDASPDRQGQLRVSRWLCSSGGKSAGLKRRRSQARNLLEPLWSQPTVWISSPANVEAVAQLDRAPGGGPGTCRFEPGRSPLDWVRLSYYPPGSVAQGKRATPYEGVRGGSIPPGPARVRSPDCNARHRGGSR
jgi:hypothetical protein